MPGAVPLLPKFQFSNNGAPMVNGTVTVYLAGTVTPSSTWQDEALTILNTNPIVLDARGEAVIYLDPALSYKFLLKNSSGVTQWTQDDIRGGGAVAEITALRVDLAASTGASLVGTMAAEAGAIPTDLQTVDRLKIHAGAHFGVDTTGATNTTTKMKAFFDACIAGGKAGHIPAGNYLITAGVLAFDNGFVDKAWPHITTDGYDNVKFLRADATDAPMITLSNGTATSGAGNYWNGGSLGGITFEQNGKATGSSQHGLSLRGVWGTKFGWMRANSGGGSCVYLPELLYGGNNPDPYGVTFCNFEGIEANYCLRYALENRNWVGLNGCVVEKMRAISTTLGGWYGLGAGNRCFTVSMGSCGGWALDDGTAAANTGGSPSRFTLGIAELDDVENGIRINKMLQFEAQQIRIIPRYNFSALNPSGGYWPRTGISIGGGVGPSVGDVSINVIWRIEAGGTKPDLGVFTNMHSVASNDIRIKNRVLDNAGFGIADTDLFTGVSTNSSSLMTRSGKVIFDSAIKPFVLVRSATTVTVPNTGYGTDTAKIAFATAMSDPGAHYSTADSWFTVPYSGLYRVAGNIALAVAAGTLVRVGFATDTAGAVGLVLNRYNYQATANAESYEITGVVSLTAGQRVFFMAQQGTAGAVNLSAPISTSADLTWSIEAL